MDYRTAPYEALCGCVSIFYDRETQPPDHIVQKHIKNCLGQRRVCVNCPVCKGSGIDPKCHISKHKDVENMDENSGRV